MATTRQLAREYANRLLAAPGKFREADKIISEVKGLTYETSNSPISQATKDEIAGYIFEIFKEEGVVYKSADNKNYLELVHYIMSQLKGDGK